MYIQNNDREEALLPAPAAPAPSNSTLKKVAKVVVTLLALTGGSLTGGSLLGAAVLSGNTNRSCPPPSNWDSVTSNCTFVNPSNGTLP